MATRETARRFGLARQVLGGHGMAAFVHLVARAWRLPVSLTHDEVAPWIWSHLEAVFPLALGAVLMPNHLHLLAGATLDDDPRAQLAKLIGGLLRSGGRRAELRFEPVAPGLVHDDPVKLLRQGRYLALNPVRSRLVDDPLEWRWSTHRDVVGAIARPWVSAERFARAVGRSPRGFEAWWQRYVAREEEVPRAAQVIPTPAAFTAFAEAPLTAVAAASASALRTRPSDVRRRGPTRDLFLAVAPRTGWDRSSLLARFCGLTPRGVQKSRRRPPPSALSAALLCLGDERLRR
jgi:hypothetical protein